MIKFNGQFSCYVKLEGDENLVWQTTDVCSKVIDDGRLFVRGSNLEGFYTYGCEQLTDNWEHKAGYIWSSRASVMNAAFDLQLIDCVYFKKGSYTPISCAVSARVLQKLLQGTNYRIDWEPRISKDKVDVNYDIKKVED